MKMKITPHEIKIKDLVAGYVDNGDDGVVGYGGKLDIRPPYQREFVYDDKDRAAVIDTIKKDYPLNVMYWAVCPNGEFEIIDGQQRTISICQYVDGKFSFDKLYFQNLQKNKQNEILDYKLQVYFCEGTHDQKLDWFKTINIAGKTLEAQELRNAVYHGSWVSDARRYFTKTSGGAAGYSKYLKGDIKRQAYLETALQWITNKDGTTLEDYMGKHQHDKTAKPLWDYFEKVMHWVKDTFENYDKLMQGLPWGIYYEKYGEKNYSPINLREQIQKLFADPDIQKQKGVYEFVLDGCKDQRLLSVRAFSPSEKRTLYTQAKGICAICKKGFKMDEMEADHIKPWVFNHDGSAGTTLENGQITCTSCNRKKGARV